MWRLILHPYPYSFTQSLNGDKTTWYLASTGHTDLYLICTNLCWRPGKQLPVDNPDLKNKVEGKGVPRKRNPSSVHSGLSCCGGDVSNHSISLCELKWDKLLFSESKQSAIWFPDKFDKMMYSFLCYEVKDYLSLSVDLLKL